MKDKINDSIVNTIIKKIKQKKRFDMLIGYKPGPPGYKDCCGSSLCVLGSECYASIERLVECGIIVPIQMSRLRLCDCCEESVFELKMRLMELKGPELVNYIKSNMREICPEVEEVTIKGMIDIICNEPEHLNEEGRNLVEQCVDFLLLSHAENYFSDKFPKKNQNQVHKFKYITIWSFIYDYLKIKRNSDYDYLLLCYLEYHHMIEHGSGIRCGWFLRDKINPYFNRNYSAEFKNKVFEWGSKVKDEV